ncbi:hypothetical protein BMS3Abin03_03134 [bacterium BMS3Abin03]|nr:hypothetical protein BMS3Abin03_03134 [bacterium BMS3Abin03]
MNIKEKLSEGNFTGLYYYNRLILPFKAHFLKVIVHDEIITDFSPSSKGIFIREKEDFTDVYFHDYKDLKGSLSKYEAIKMVVVEKGEDVFDFNNHLKLALYLEKKHIVKIEKCEEDILFLE